MVVAPRVCTGPDGDKAIAALVVGQRVAAAGEIGIEAGVVVVMGMQVASGGVGLPDFHQRATQRPAVGVEHPADHDDTLADGLATMLTGEILVFRHEIGS